MGFLTNLGPAGVRDSATPEPFKVRTPLTPSRRKGKKGEPDQEQQFAKSSVAIEYLAQVCHATKHLRAVMESTTLIQAPSETDVTSTPIKKRQCSLFETFSGEKRPRMTETTETLQMSSHKKLRSKLSGASLVAFEVKLEKVRELD